MPQHFLGGIFGVSMIAFFTQNVFASASGNSNLPNGLLFGGGILAVHQLGIEVMGIVVSLLAVFLISYLIISIIGVALHGITEDSEYPVETKKGVIPSGAK
jgi:Amt family ammonium transporter